MKTIRTMLAVALLGIASMSHAASVTLVPVTPAFPIAIGEVFTVEIIIDFTAEGGTLGGGFDLTFDESMVSLVSFTDTVILGDPAFGRPPDYVPGSGLLESWGVGDFSGLFTGTVGQASFEIVGYLDGLVMSLGPTAGIAGPWVSAVDFVTIIEPDYNSLSVIRIPLPAAVWFMLGGLGALAGLARRRP